MVFATVPAISLNPLMNHFALKKVNRVLSTTIALILPSGAIGGTIYFLSSRAAHFGGSLPTMKVNFKGLCDDAVQWVSACSILLLVLLPEDFPEETLLLLTGLVAHRGDVDLIVQ